MWHSSTPSLPTVCITFLSFHQNIKVCHSASGCTGPSPRSHRLHTQAAGSAYECSNWRHSDLHGWTWWGRGTGQSESTHKLLGRDEAVPSCTEVMCSLHWRNLTHSVNKGGARGRRWDHTPNGYPTDSWMYSSVNITERAAMTMINHQSYSLTFVNTEPFQRQTFSQR